MTTTFARAAATLALATGIIAGKAEAAGLGGSLRSMTVQHRVAVQEDYPFLATQAQVRALAEEGKLERLSGNGDYVVSSQVVHPYARAEVRMLVERLASQYRRETGQRLVITSLVRPQAEQPANAHRLSVHPAGMALDLRVPSDSGHRRWLERTLLALEQKGVLDVTREHRPPHYHVAVFPAAYRAYVERREAAVPATPVAAPVAAPVAVPAVAAVPPLQALAAVPPAGVPTRDTALIALIVVTLGGAAMAWARPVRAAASRA
jgi:hypothetical protein